MDRDDFPVILGFGQFHDMQDQQPEHRFWRFKSTLRAAAIAYGGDQSKPRNPLGFHKPK